MSPTNSIAWVNEQLARQINQEARQNPQSQYAGKLVGIANGKVVVIADSWLEVANRLRKVESDPTHCYCIDASADYQRVDEPVPVVGVFRVPPGFDGIAGFRFLNRFHYGNSADPSSF